MINEDIQINIQAKYDSLKTLEKQLDKLKESIGSLGKARIDTQLQTRLKNSIDVISDISTELKKATKDVTKWREEYNKAVNTGDKESSHIAEIELQNAQSVLANVVKTIESADVQKAIARQASGGLTTISDWRELVKQAEAYAAKQEKIRKEQEKWKSVGKQIEAVAKKMGLLGKETKKTSSWFSKLLGRIRNISIYRTIRRGLQIVFQTITQGFERVTKLNKEAEQSALRLKADYNLIATAVGVTVSTLLNVFIGDIDKFTDKLLEYINAFNKALAITSGQTTYLKVIRGEITKINKETQKLSFDKFEALSQKDETLSGVKLEPTIISTDEKLTKTETNMLNFIQTVKKLFETIEPILSRLWEVLRDIFTDIILPILNSGAVDFILDIVAGIIKILDELGLLKGAIITLFALKIGWNILQFGAAIYNMLPFLTKLWYQLTAKIIPAINNMVSKMKIGIVAAAAFLGGFLIMDSILSNFSGTAKIVVSAIMLIVGAVVAIYTAIQLVTHAWTGFGAIALAAAAGGVALAAIKGIVTGAQEVNAKGYATGGIPEKSELFYMNEYGRPEALVNTGGSQTNVINIDQLSEGMRRGFVEAIYETGLIDAMQTRIVVDGDNVNDNAFARAIFPALKTESRRRGGNQL